MRYRSIYQAKHTYATLALQDGENPALVARNLGISLSTLTNHYVAALQRGQLIRAEKASINPTETPRLARLRKFSRQLLGKKSGGGGN